MHKLLLRCRDSLALINNHQIIFANDAYHDLLVRKVRFIASSTVLLKSALNCPYAFKHSLILKSKLEAVRYSSNLPLIDKLSYFIFIYTKTLLSWLRIIFCVNTYYLPVLNETTKYIVYIDGIARSRPPNYESLSDIKLYPYQSRLSVGEIYRLFIDALQSNSILAPFHHACYQILLREVPFSNVEHFFYEDCGNMFKRAFASCCKKNNIPISGYISADLPDIVTCFFEYIMGAQLYTNRPSVVMMFKSLDLPPPIFSNYQSKCFSGLDSIDADIYTPSFIGIVFPWFESFQSQTYHNFLEYLLSHHATSILCISVHPQCLSHAYHIIDAIEEISTAHSWSLRTHSMSDLAFVSSSKYIIGGQSSLCTLAEELNVNYILL